MTMAPQVLVVRLTAAVLIAILAALSTLAPIVAHAQAAASAYTTGYRWDPMRRLVGEISPPVTGATGPFLATRYTYDADGQLIRTEKGSLSAWQADSVLPASWSGFTVTRVVDVVYDAVGNKLRETVSSGATAYVVTQYAYDGNDRVTCTTVRMNLASLPADACTLGTEGAQGKDRITRNIYDGAGQVVQVRKALLTPREQAYATYSYTQNGKQEFIIDANGNRAKMEYDGFDRQVKWIFPSLTRPSAYNPATQATALSTAGALSTDDASPDDYEQYTYDKNGNRLSLRKRDNTTITYTFDALNRMTAKDIPDRANLAATHERDVFYAYDLRGLMTAARFDSAAGAEGVTTVYDKAGRIQSSRLAMDNLSPQLAYQYDANGNRERVTWPDTAYVQYGFDGLNRPAQVSANAADWTHTYGYSDDGDLTSDLVGPTPNTSNYANTALGRDPIGRLSSLGRTLPVAGLNNTITFGYNSASQITSEGRSNDTYAFTRTASTKAYTSNGLNQYSSITQGSTYTNCYDANGNLTSDGLSVYLYDVENRLVEKRAYASGSCAALSYSGLLQASLRYDPMGRLYETAVDPSSTATITRFLIDGDALVAEYNSSGTMLRRYVHGADGKADDPIAWYEGAAMTNGAVRYLYTNHQGSVVLAADTAGGSASQFKYDEYGNTAMTAPAGCGANLAPSCGGRFLYTGQVLIPELQMYYYKARVYTPALGRFMQVDPIGYADQNNLYAYVANDPLNKTDPTGLQEIPPENMEHIIQAHGAETDRTRPGNSTFSQEYSNPAALQGLAIDVFKSHTAPPVVAPFGKGAIMEMRGEVLLKNTKSGQTIPYPIGKDGNKVPTNQVLIRYEKATGKVITMFPIPVVRLPPPPPPPPKPWIGCFLKICI